MPDGWSFVSTAAGSLWLPGDRIEKQKKQKMERNATRAHFSSVGPSPSPGNGRVVRTARRQGAADPHPAVMAVMEESR